MCFAAHVRRPHLDMSHGKPAAPVPRPRDGAAHRCSTEARVGRRPNQHRARRSPRSHDRRRAVGRTDQCADRADAQSPGRPLHRRGSSRRVRSAGGPSTRPLFEPSRARNEPIRSGPIVSKSRDDCDFAIVKPSSTPILSPKPSYGFPLIAKAATSTRSGGPARGRTQRRPDERFPRNAGPLMTLRLQPTVEIVESHRIHVNSTLGEGSR